MKDNLKAAGLLLLALILLAFCAGGVWFEIKLKIAAYNYFQTH